MWTLTSAWIHERMDGCECVCCAVFPFSHRRQLKHPTSSPLPFWGAHLGCIMADKGVQPWA